MSLGEHSSTDALGDLQGKGDKFTKLAIIERKKMSDLQDAINYLSKQIDNYREMAKKAAIDVMNIHVLTPNPAYSRADGVNIGREAQMVTAKTLHVLEAKLNKLLQRQAVAINVVKQKKEVINHFRLIRLQTDITHGKFENTLGETKLKIESLLGESSKVVEDREKLLEKIDVLEKLNKEEQQEFQEKYEEMGRFVKAQNDTLEDSLLQERKADRAGQTNKANTTGQAFDGMGIASEMTLDEEVELAKQVGSLNSFMSAEQNSLADLRTKIATYETMFDQLKSMTNVESLEDMVSNYIAHEEEMFSLYNFIQQTNADIDAVVESTAQTEKDIMQFQNEQNDQEEQRLLNIHELQQRLQLMLMKNEEMKAKNSAEQETIAQIAKKVNTVFLKLQCDQMEAKAAASKAQRFSNTGGNAGGGGGGGAVSAGAGGSAARAHSKIAMLISSGGPNESSILDYLGIIEMRSVEIISEYQRVMNAKEMLAGTNRMNLNRSPTPGPPSPVNWESRKGPLTDIDNLSDDEFLMNLEGIPGISSAAANAVVGMAPSDRAGGGGGGDADGENKIVDLSAFKSKLQRRLGIKESASNPQLKTMGSSKRNKGGDK